MKHVSRAYDGVVYGMAVIAAVLMTAMMATITLDVILRNLGYQSSAHFFTFTEYALLIVPCLGAPWLAREKGHIYVEIVLNSLPPRGRSPCPRAASPSRRTTAPIPTCAPSGGTSPASRSRRDASSVSS